MALEERKAIAKGSKSFYLASLFFPPDVREGSWQLYRWCRHCDDQIDRASNFAEALQRLSDLRRQTTEALFTTTTTEKTMAPEFESLKSVCQKYQIPPQYPLDLIQGFEMDVTGKSYQTIEDLELYSYYVAGVVGLMMTRIFGVSSPTALRHAVDMGTAMQLTNIARDIAEDFQLKRIYLPKAWLQEHQISDQNLLDPSHQENLMWVVNRLLQRSKELYQSGYAGLQFLPFRAALAVSIAGSIYSFIGGKVRSRRKVHQRVYVTFPEKILLSFIGAARVLPMGFRRLLRPWKALPTVDLWRPS